MNMDDSIEAESDERTSSNPKLAAAARDVALAQEKFSADLRRVSDAGQRLTQNVMKNARPVLLGVAVVTGVGLIVTLWRARRRPRSLRLVSGPERRSPFWELGKAAVVALASSAGRHLAVKYAEPFLAMHRIGDGTESPQGPRPAADS
jgi:hypothetical protein